LLIAGSGPDEAMLRIVAEQMGIADRIHWLGFRNDLPNVLRGADVFVLSSRREGMANVMLEALAAGCLVIAADVSGVRAALGARAGRPEAGWIVPVENEAALTAALEDVLRLRHKDAAQAYRDEARFRVENWFSLPRMISDVERVLARPVASR
jgi:glycosyltransferase involved in cell wall biosynthesis